MIVCVGLLDIRSGNKKSGPDLAIWQTAFLGLIKFVGVHTSFSICGSQLISMRVDHTDTERYCYEFKYSCYV